MERAYQNDSDWSRPFVKELAVSLGLDRIKVYKWHYTKKNKVLSQIETQNCQRAL